MKQIYIIIFFLIICCIFTLNYIMMSEMDRKVYLYFLKSYKVEYLKYLSLFYNTTLTTKYYKTTLYLLFVSFPFIFPIMCNLIPNYNTYFVESGELLMVPLYLKKDENLHIVENMSSKYYWFNLFQQYGINTPNVYVTIIDKQENILTQPDSLTKYICKPINGSEGQNIFLMTYDEFLIYSKTHDNIILQSYIQDDNVNRSRHFRINTYFDKGRAKLFYMYYLTHPDNGLITNRPNGGVINNVDTLDISTKKKLLNICNSLNNLHDNEFDKASFIGWDVILTKGSYYVLEGNLFPALNINDNVYQNYIDILQEMYKKN